MLAECDLCAITKLSHKTISLVICKYEIATNTLILRRGTVHDMGRSLTHKRIICYKHSVLRITTPQIARETNHSIQDVERYIADYKRVKYCLLKKMDESEISVMLKMSPSLVQEYIHLISSFADPKVNQEMDNNLFDRQIKDSI